MSERTMKEKRKRVYLKPESKLIRQNEMYRFGKTKCDYFV